MLLKLSDRKVIILAGFLLSTLFINPCWANSSTLVKHIGRITNPLLEKAGLKGMELKKAQKIIEEQLGLGVSMTAIIGMKGKVRGKKSTKIVFNNTALSTSDFATKGGIPKIFELFAVGMSGPNVEKISFSENKRIVLNAIEELFSNMPDKKPEELLPVYAAVINWLLLPANWFPVKRYEISVLGNDIEAAAMLMYFADSVTRASAYSNTETSILIAQLNTALKNALQADAVIPGTNNTYRNMLEVAFSAALGTAAYGSTNIGLVFRSEAFEKLAIFKESFTNLAFRLGVTDAIETHAIKKTQLHNWFSDHAAGIDKLTLTAVSDNLPLFIKRRKF